MSPRLVPWIILAYVGFFALFWDSQLHSKEFDNVPGQVLLHRPAESGSLVASPSLAIMPNGDYFAKADWSGKTWVFRSTDRGATWMKLRPAAVTDNDVMKWGNLFVHNGHLYLLGTRVPRGDIIIRRYKPENDTWTKIEGKRGRLLNPDHDAFPPDNGYHTAPVSTVVHNGRIWRAYERFEAGGWGGFNVMAMSAPVDSDLLDPKSWTFTNEVRRDFEWHNGQFFSWLEGNVVIDRNGKLVDILRVDLRNKDGTKPCGIAAIVNIDSQTDVSFDPSSGFIEFPGGQKKFTIRYDPPSDRYWSITNFMPQQFRIARMNGERFRGMASLISSNDLREWQVEQVAVTDPRLLSPDPKVAQSGLIAGKFKLWETKSGLQYVDFQIDGDDMPFVTRTAYNDGMGGPRDCHDSNFCTFHKIKDFRRAPPHVLVADAGNNRVLRFEAQPEGPWYALHEFAADDYVGRPLQNPVGLAQDDRGFIYICEGVKGGRVLRFDAAGNFLNIVATEGRDFQGLPATIALRESHFLALCTARDGQRREYVINLLEESIRTKETGSPATSPSTKLAIGQCGYEIVPTNHAIMRDGDGSPVVQEGLREPASMIVVTKPRERRWMAGKSGDWDNYYNWHAYWGTPNTLSEVAVFAESARSLAEVRLNSPKSLAGLRFANDHGYTICGDGRITLASKDRPTFIEVFSGDHTIDVPLTLETDVKLYLAKGTSLTIRDRVDRQGHTIETTGAGQLSIGP